MAYTAELHELGFRVWSRQNRCAAADLEPGHGRHCWGVIYDIPEHRVRRQSGPGVITLDEIESEGQAYDRVSIDLCWSDGGKVRAPVQTYLVRQRVSGLRTAAHYARHLVRGLLEHGAPPDYLEYVRARIKDSNPRLDAVLKPLLS